MTDYAQEQADELEALSSIFMDDLQEVTDSIPSGWSLVGSAWRVVVGPQEEEGEEMEYPLKVEIVFAHTPTYPDEPPLLKARGLQGISDADVSMLQGVLEEAVQDNLGMAMIYTLVTTAQEWVQEKASSVAVPSHDPEAEEKRRREAEEARLAELRAHGHPVTPEAFAEWRAKFDAEQALERSKLVEGKAEDKQNRPTGKQWFRQQEEQHLEVEEPELEPDEEDGEDAREHWGSSGEEEDDLDYGDESDEDEEELLDELLASKGS
ncbi:hypothetical protein CHLNCDRAFT_58090 [Chlorella variabilis]|uniref:RWD domain-containing protein n=1 Tax=Chlorella variabilis TaxID=554065 RepID=E1ZH38_CHLVA|nr:hypothetical protein CHLNCDRAFT_58090 [Chlorella variabilis]EFN55051.1 hypothetical protein CHLNCDRAFT_58090 [Chlorella variabilis]|eukprot:XP_005847153.1 hypothetical protein CHLNCDRAFT_58090 [Chlorella variabilis]